MALGKPPRRKMTEEEIDKILRKFQKERKTKKERKKNPLVDFVSALEEQLDAYEKRKGGEKNDR